jgi:hypothetical protein
MDGRGGDAEDGRHLPDIDHRAAKLAGDRNTGSSSGGGDCQRWRRSSDMRCGAALAIENAGEDGIGIVVGETAHEGDGRLVGATVAGLERGRATSLSVRTPPLQRKAR